MTTQRQRIKRHIATHPGVHFNALTRELELAPGQVQYHLKRLKRVGAIIEESLYGRTHYYPPEYGPWERGAIAVVRRETARDILLELIAAGPSDPATIAETVGIARSTLEWHLDHLIEQDLVRKEKDASNQVTLVVAHPDDTARMLRQITPSLPDRLVDRFTRLVDSLLGESPTHRDD